MTTRCSLNIWVFQVCLLFAVAMDAVLYLQPGLVSYSAPLKGSVIACLLVFACALLLRKSTYSSPDMVVLMLLTGIFIAYSFSSTFPADSLNRAIKQVFLTVIYLTSAYFLRCGAFRRRDLVRLATVGLMILVPVSMYLAFNPIVEHLVQAAGPYALLWLLLFAFLVVRSEDRLLTVLMLAGTLALMLILKRGAILCLALALCYWIILRNRHFPRLSTLVQTLLLAAILAGVITVFWISRGDQLLERLQDTTGSGRNLLYALIYNGFIGADLMQLLFGHGSIAVQELTGLAIGTREGARYGIQAHNDWLTLAYDFGLLGAGLFLAFHIAIYRRIQRLKRSDLRLYIKLRPIHAAIFLSSFFSEIFFNTSLIFAYVLLGIMASPNNCARVINEK